MADIMVKMNRIIEAIRSTVPEELWPEIMRKLDEETGSSTDSIEVLEADDVEYGPAEFAGDDDDDFDTSRSSPARKTHTPDPHRPTSTTRTGPEPSAKPGPTAASRLGKAATASACPGWRLSD
jgi:hypothetical protein